MRAVMLMAVVGLCHGCSVDPPVGPSGELPPADLRVLFIGNSLTYTYDVPAIVQALADRAGRSLSHGTIAYPNYALEDHWNAGVAQEIQRLKADVVVMQQGPSSLPESRVDLITWSGRIAEAVRAAGGEPALYMVWPDASRTFAFGAVHDSYLAAATAVNGKFIPAGSAWLEVWSRDATAQLYAPDGLHQSYLGAMVAAHTIYAVLFDADPLLTPALNSNIPAETLDLVRMSVKASLEAEALVPPRPASGDRRLTRELPAEETWRPRYATRRNSGRSRAQK